MLFAILRALNEWFASSLGQMPINNYVGKKREQLLYEDGPTDLEAGVFVSNTMTILLHALNCIGLMPPDLQ